MNVQRISSHIGRKNQAVFYTSGLSVLLLLLAVFSVYPRSSSAQGQRHVKRPGGTKFAKDKSAVTSAISGSWSTIDPMPVARFDVSVATGVDGRIYAFGGEYSGITSMYLPLNHVDRYDPATGIWSAVTPMPTARGCTAAAVGGNGLIYVFGGFDRDINPLNTVEAYDPAANTWTTKTSMPTARMCLGAATGSDGRIYVIGGAVGSGAGLDTVEAYDPATDTWATVASMLTARYVMGVVAGADGLIYAIAGADNVNTALTTVEAYDPVADTWTAKPSISTGRYNPAAVAGLNGRIYVIGGADALGDAYSGPFNTVEVYDPLDPDAGWSAGVPMPTARYDLGVATDAEGRIYAIGGYDEAKPLNTVEMHQP